jgi:polysaccharide export outer membrane protein
MLRLLVIAAISVLFNVACSTTGAPGPVATSGASGAQAQAQDQADAFEPSLAPSYRLGAGDQVRIIVFGEEDLSGEFFVDGSGMVSLPLIGEAPAAGKTLAEFRAELEARLSDGYLNDPRVSAEVLNYRPFYILGEVEESGEYPYTDGLTVMNAVARAGGFTYRANTRVVFIKRADTEAEVEVPLTATVRVMPGDTIRIAERFF